jgi:hypothetical protein
MRKRTVFTGGVATAVAVALFVALGMPLAAGAATGTASSPEVARSAVDTIPRAAAVTSTPASALRAAALQARDKVCPAAPAGTPGTAPSKTSPLGVGGTTSADLAAFAARYNAVRVQNCLTPIAPSRIKYDSCMEARLFWMAEDPSSNPSSAWGHTAVAKRSDGKKITGCDGNLAGGAGNTGTTVATKWWDSTSHRASLYRPTYTGSVANVCIYFAMTHGGIVGDKLGEPTTFTRAAARWDSC